MKITTEDQIIISHTKDWLASTTECAIELFAAEMLAPALAEAGIDIEQTQPDHSDAKAYLKWKNTRGVQINRVINGTTKFPLSWKWTWLGLLPEPFYSRCRADLLAMAGVMDVPLPDIAAAQERQTRACLADLMRKTADVLAAAAPADDGVYDLNDDPEQLDVLVDALLDVRRVLDREVMAISAATGRTGRIALYQVKANG